jgi:hypothetical protein
MKKNNKFLNIINKIKIKKLVLITIIIIFLIFGSISAIPKNHPNKNNNSENTDNLFLEINETIDSDVLYASLGDSQQKSIGAIWTTLDDCGDMDQNVNLYGPMEEVWINGENFIPSRSYDWSIFGLPGSCDSNTIVASGVITADSNGDFCFFAYTINDDDCGGYKCNVGNKTDNYGVGCVDRDMDGFSPDPLGLLNCGDSDCDDNDPDTYPGAPELCDGLDNNCDGIIPSDEIDDDNDGYTECEGDCNDNDDTIYPGAPEICDGKDNDCDGIIPPDEIDDDGDTYPECRGDCNDNDDTIYRSTRTLRQKRQQLRRHHTTKRNRRRQRRIHRMRRRLQRQRRHNIPNSP